MSKWQDVRTAPKEGKNRYKDPAPRIDILAKIWLKDSDTFEFRRFTDCWWYAESGNVRKGYWKGVEEGYLAVAWMTIPEIPKEWPPKVEPATLRCLHVGGCPTPDICALTACCMPPSTSIHPGSYATSDAIDGNQPAADEDNPF